MTRMNLSDLENLSAVDVGIYSPSHGSEPDFCLGVLAVSKAHISKQLLDRIVQAPEIEYKALTPIKGLCEILALNTIRNVMIHCLFGEGAYFGVPNLFRTVFRACAPLEKPISVSLSDTAASVSGHNLSFPSSEPVLTISHAFWLLCRAVYGISRHPLRWGLCRRVSENNIVYGTYRTYRTYLYVSARIYTYLPVLKRIRTYSYVSVRIRTYSYVSVRICTYLYVLYVLLISGT